MKRSFWNESHKIKDPNLTFCDYWIKSALKSTSYVLKMADFWISIPEPNPVNSFNSSLNKQLVFEK